MVESQRIKKTVRAPKVGRNSDFFFTLFIDMETEIKKITEIEHQSLDYISNFLDNFDYYNSNIDICSIGNIRNDLIYYNENASLRKNYYCPIHKSIITQFKNEKLTEELTKFVDHLKKLYDIKYLWLMVYSPTSCLDFHWDHGKNRHVISLNRNERFFNYENNQMIKNGGQSKCKLYNEKLLEKKDDIDSFNKFFINDSELSSIHILDIKSVYVFGNSLHTFVNGSDKLRLALVFEIMD